MSLGGRKRGGGPARPAAPVRGLTPDPPPILGYIKPEIPANSPKNQGIPWELLCKEISSVPSGSSTTVQNGRVVRAAACYRAARAVLATRRCLCSKRCVLGSQEDHSDRAATRWGG